MVAGFLGAGKTTLLNALLRDTDEPLGVIVNDFGAVNIDAALVAGETSVAGEVALQNGCICCEMRGDLLAALLSLVRRTNPPRHILIEASGVSDPAGIVRTFLDPKLSDFIELAAVIGCVDPSEFPRLVGDDWTMAKGQLAVCDFVVLTKADATTEDQRAATEELVRTMAPRARVLVSGPDAEPSTVLLGTAALWDQARVARTPEPGASAHIHEAGHAHGHHHHGVHAFETYTYRAHRPLSVYGLRRALAKLPSGVYRAKGFVHVCEDPETRVLVQVVGGRAELRVHGPWGQGEPCTELVFLGREGRVPAAALQSSIDACIHDGRPAAEGFMDDMVGYFNRLLAGQPGAS